MADETSDARPMSKLERHLRSPEVRAGCDEIDARVNAPGYVPPPVAWLSDPFGPDPFGGNWDWMMPSGDDEAIW